ncbi:hypothetical protein JCM8547_008055 [Rhodosporidiobolus lusitaniae]
MRPSLSSSLAGLVGAVLAMSSVGVHAAPIVLAGDGLTEETWGRVSEGTWLVEHYSPYCSHCKSFAPRWKELVDSYSLPASSHNFHFAQVDCAANGDLCHAHSVKYYPSIFLYVDGEFKEEFTERRTLEELGKFVEEHYPASSGSGKEKALEKAVDEQVGMGEQKKGGKARLPKEDEEVGLPILHVTDDDGSPSSSSTSKEDDDEPYEELLEDARKDGENEILYPSSPTSSPASHPEATTQTPPSSPTPASPSSGHSHDKNPKFVAQQPAPRSEHSSSSSVLPKADGTVQVLTREGLEALKSDDEEPAFVKYYAPWCGHCKKLAPKWKDLAGELSTSVHVFEVDCDASENKQMCRTEKVQAYPTLIFYNKGAQVEYMGKRDVESMKQFALKTMSASTVKFLTSPSNLRHAVQSEPVVILFLHSATTPSTSISLAHSAAKSLLGFSASFFSSSSSEIFSTLHLSSDSPPQFVVLKDGSLTPHSVFPLPGVEAGSDAYRVQLARQWLRSAKLPTVSELNGATYSDLMPGKKDLVGPTPPPLVGLVVLSRKALGESGWDQAQAAFLDLARGWAERRKMGSRGEEKGRDVVWAWVDGDRWAGWARSMFDIKEGGKAGPAVVVADSADLSYYPLSLSSSSSPAQPLTLETSSSVVYELIEKGIYEGKAERRSSRNAVERWGAKLSSTFSSLYSTTLSHPILAFLLVAASWVFLWKALKRCCGDERERDYRPLTGGGGGGRGPKRE